MFRYVPDMFRAETADTEEEADRWYDDKSVRRTPDLLPRDEVARAINSEIKAGRGTEHGGVFLDIASRRPADYIKRKLPGMYHQFRQLADVDITKEPMEIGPTCHYMMGGVRVDPETAAATVPGVFAAGEVAAGLHGSNRLGGNSLSRPARVRPAGRAGGGRARARARGDAGRRRRRSGGRRRGCARAVRPRPGREPLLDPPRPRGLHAQPGRDHPDRGRAEAGARRDRGLQGARRTRRGRGPPAVQPGVAPRARPRSDAGRVRGHRARGAGAHGRAGAGTPATTSRRPIRSSPR